jgi:zinc finger HIT domain-containing protein 3
LPSCSVACNKIHKENHPPDPEPSTPAEANASNTNAADAQATGPKNPFGFLDDSQHLRYLFKRYPNLPRQLLAIVAETDPPAEAQHSTIKEALLAKAAAASQPKKEQWNHDVGIRKGKEALRKARKADGDLGEGIREYTELIAHLTSEDARNREADELLRQEAKQRDAELIRKLIEEEKR